MGPPYDSSRAPALFVCQLPTGLAHVLTGIRIRATVVSSVCEPHLLLQRNAQSRRLIYIFLVANLSMPHCVQVQTPQAVLLGVELADVSFSKQSEFQKLLSIYSSFEEMLGVW